jgi:uncharacterized Zn finger protein
VSPTEADLAGTPVFPARLRAEAGETFFARGVAYFERGAVRSLRMTGQGVEAIVAGTHDYRVRLALEDGGFDYSCSCPVGRDGLCCKHCVAVGLAWHEAASSGQAADLPPEPPIQAYLAGLDKAALVRLLLEQAEADERLHRRLALAAAGSAPDPERAQVWKASLAEAIDSGGFVDYRDAYEYAGGIEEVIDSLAGMIEAGQAAVVIELAEHGVEEIDEAMQHVDDSDGWMGGLLGRLQDIHLTACKVARPDPEALAERLFDMEMESDYEAFYRSAFTYADILGATGLAAYRRLAEAQWARVKPLAPGEDDPGRYGNRFRITSIMEALAEAEDDFDALVAIKARDLSAPYDFLKIAELCAERGAPDLALDWAERGWRAFPVEGQDDRLRRFLADAWQSAGRAEAAVALSWEGFAGAPALATYRELARHAHQAGGWPDWREKALGLIRNRIAARGDQPPSGKRLWVDPFETHSLLVEIFLAEGDAEAAWAEARAGDCSRGLWLRLAREREEAHPAEAIGVYREEVARLLRHTGNDIYREAVDYLEKIGALSDRCGEEEAFAELLGDLRTNQRRKRNLMKLFDERGW